MSIIHRAAPLVMQPWTNLSYYEDSQKINLRSVRFILAYSSEVGRIQGAANLVVHEKLPSDG